VEEVKEKKEYNWENLLFMGGYHLFLLITLPIYFYYYTPSLSIVLVAIALWVLCELAITAGYHRLFSHCSYKANPIVKFVAVFFGSMAFQGSVLKWSHDHRLHHAHVDTEDDPYSITKGFMHAHVLWVIYKGKGVDLRIVSDLTKSKLLLFQHKHNGLCSLLSNLIVFLVVGHLLGDYLGAFIFTLWVRAFFVHHCTWFINSLAHFKGTQFYSTEHTAVDNYIISLLTLGEGYHNFHHTFAHDYRNGIRWYHFDPTKWCIWLLSKVKLVTDLKQVDNLRIKKKLIECCKGKILQKVQKEENRNRVDTLTQKLLNNISMMQKEKDASIFSSIKAEFEENMKEWKSFLRSLKQDEPMLFKS